MVQPERLMEILDQLREDFRRTHPSETLTPEVDNELRRSAIELLRMEREEEGRFRWPTT